MPASRAQIISADIRNINGFVLGLATYGQQLNAHRYESSSLYANVLGNVDTTNGYALKVQYGDPDGSPVTIASFAKGSVYLNGVHPDIPLQELASSADSPLVALAVDNDFSRIGITTGSLTTGELGSPMVNFQKIALPDQYGTVDGDIKPSGGFGGPLYVGYTRRGSNLLASTQVVSSTNNSVTCAPGTFTAAMVTAGGVVEIVAGVGATVAGGTYQPRKITAINGDGSTATIDYTWAINPTNPTSYVVVNKGNALSSSPVYFQAYDDSTVDLGASILHHHIGLRVHVSQANTSTANLFGGEIVVDNTSTVGFATGFEIDTKSRAGDSPAYTTEAGAAMVTRGLIINNSGTYLGQVAVNITAALSTTAWRNGIVFGQDSVVSQAINFSRLATGSLTPQLMRAARGQNFFVAPNLAGNDVNLMNWSTADALIFQNGTGSMTLGATGATSGVTVAQGAADDIIFQLQSSDVGHGVTTVDGTTNVPTSSYGFFSKAVAANGGLMMTGIDDTANIGVRIRGVTTTAQGTPWSTSSVGAVIIDGYLKNGTGVTTLGASQNVLVVRDNSLARFALDSNGDSHQDVGTAWTNFDDFDDAALLNTLADEVARPDDPIRDEFRRFLTYGRADLERARIVAFNEDGHHFANMSRLTMLLTGAVRRLGLEAVEMRERLALQDAKLAALAPGLPQ